MVKVLNINLHFYPESIGGAAVVAEKLAWGMTKAGHQVTNIYLSTASDECDFAVKETPFGRSIGIKNVPGTPANRYYNPITASLLNEIYELVVPDKIVIHAVQHMGILEFLSNPEILEKTCIVAHDFFWVCLQGFRSLPSGSDCNLCPSSMSCRQCAWYPGLTDTIYTQCHHILQNCKAVIFPSEFLMSEYTAILGQKYDNFTVLSNPDMAETVIEDKSCLPLAAGRRAKAKGKTVFGFMGGPGETKGWGLVQKFMERSKKMAESTDAPHVVLYDIGRGINAPWYQGLEAPGITIADPFHWTYAKHALGNIDVLLMPSNVRESFGLAAREALSLNKSCIIRLNGALSELEGCLGVVVATAGDDVDSLLDKLAGEQSSNLHAWPGTSINDYTGKVLNL